MTGGCLTSTLETNRSWSDNWQNGFPRIETDKCYYVNYWAEMFFILSIISQWVWLTTRFSNAARIDDFPMETSMQHLGISLFFLCLMTPDKSRWSIMLNPLQYHYKHYKTSFSPFLAIISYQPWFLWPTAKIRAVFFRISCNSHGLAIGGGHPAERERDSTYKYERTYKIL